MKTDIRQTSVSGASRRDHADHEHTPAPVLSALGASASHRLLVAVALASILWLTVGWAIR